MSKENYQSPFRRYDLAHDGAAQAQPTDVRLRRQLQRVLDRHIPKGTRVALVDFPLGLDLGRSANWLGMLSYLRQRQARIRYLADVTSYDRRQLDRALGDGTILLAGGGTFGDHAVEDHEHRLQVMRDFAHRRVIQLPQSIHFEDRVVLEESKHVIDSHPRFTLLVRDRQSKVFAERKFNVEINLCPDMAWQLETLPEGATPRTGETLVIGRCRDKCQRELARAFPSASFAAERLVEGMRILRVASRTARRRYARYQTGPWPRMLRTMMLRRLTMRILNDEVSRGVAEIQAAGIVLTDDISVHALCLLHNKPHLLVDDGQGCTTSGWESWTPTSPLVSTMGSWREGLRLARGHQDGRLPASATSPARRAA